MDEEKDILSSDNAKLTDEDLLKYLHEHLSEEDMLDLEKKVSGPFERDAVDGLKQIKDKASLQRHVLQLNKKLPQMLHTRKRRYNPSKIKDLQWTILALIILLIICLVAFVVIGISNNTL